VSELIRRTREKINYYDRTFVAIVSILGFCVSAYFGVAKYMNSMVENTSAFQELKSEVKVQKSVTDHLENDVRSLRADIKEGFSEIRGMLARHPRNR